MCQCLDCFKDHLTVVLESDLALSRSSSLKLLLMVSNVHQRKTELQSIQDLPLVKLLIAAGFGKVSSPGMPPYILGLCSTSLLPVRSWQAGRQHNPSGKMETCASFPWSPLNTKPGRATYSTEIPAVVTGKAYPVAMIYILMLSATETLGTGTSKKFDRWVYTATKSFRRSYWCRMPLFSESFYEPN